MRAPKNIIAASTDETAAIKSMAARAQCGREFTDETANAIIAHCNRLLTDLGMPEAGLMCMRKNGQATL